VTISGEDIADLSGLSVLTSIGGTLEIRNNDNLTTLSGLENLTFIEGSLTIGGWFGNEGLTSLTGLDNLVSIGGTLTICGNENLANLTALNSLTTIGGDLSIAGNYSLTSLNGLEKIVTIGGGLRIGGGFFLLGGNRSLISLEGLNNLTSISGGLCIASNFELKSLEALQNLISIDGNLTIGAEPAGVAGGNYSLTNLRGLHNISAGSIDTISIIYNSLLSNCDVEGICNWLGSPNGTIEIHNNAVGCNSPEEVEAACDSSSSVGEINSFDSFSISPNPCSGTLHLRYQISDYLISDLYSISGIHVKRLLNEMKTPGEYEMEVDLSELPPGIYFCTLKTEDNIQTVKLIKL